MLSARQYQSSRRWMQGSLQPHAAMHCCYSYCRCSSARRLGEHSWTRAELPTLQWKGQQKKQRRQSLRNPLRLWLKKKQRSREQS
jgi:hypothetical protein